MSAPVPVSGTPAIAIRGLRKEYVKGKQRTVAVDDLDLTVHRGEVFGLLGPNGAGKTTTVEVCEGLTLPTAGSVEILGMQWRTGHDDTIRSRIGACLQETKFTDHATVRETIALFAAFYRKGRSVDEVLGLVSLHERADSRQSSLSGGQRQRLAVATALVGEPELLFLDEPTTGLDPSSRRALWDVVRTFRAGGGTVVLTTHYMDEAQQLCDRIAIVDAGKVIALGTPRELIRSLGGEYCVELDADELGARVVRADLLALPGVVACDVAQTRAVLVVTANDPALATAVQHLLAAKNVTLQSLATRHASLEDVFVHLTGRHLRDEGKP